MSPDRVLDTLQTAFHELSAGLPLTWLRVPAGAAPPLDARPRRGWHRWDPAHPGRLRRDAPNWFCAEFRFPETWHGLPLAGTEALLFMHGYCPFTLWVDGQEAYRETHVWHASGPIADPIACPIEPGRRHRLVLRLDPTALPAAFNPLQVAVIPRLGLETGVDTLAAAAQLALARTLAEGAEEQALLAAAVRELDLAALRARRWDAFHASVERMEQALLFFTARARGLTLHLIGHTHIDMDWQWTWADTVHCARRDLRSTVALLRDRPDLRFSLSQVPLYEIAREHDPEVFSDIRRLVAEGRWENVAATWVEGDLNMADGEAIARHLLYAAEWGRRELGGAARVFWAPDTFGHPANMPQIARLGGCDSYFHWRCNPGGAANWPARLWQGVDGTEILALSSAYGGALYPGVHMYTLFHNLLAARRFGLSTAHHVWGSGDHGGGLPRLHLELLERFRHRPVMPTFRFSTVAEYQAALLRERERLPRNRGETHLLFEGCFTTHAQAKSDNRRGEGALLDAETLAALAGHDRAAALRDAWTPVLYNQFHDIFDGAAVAESYAAAARRTAASLASAEAIAADALGSLAGPPAADGSTVVAWNTLAHPRGALLRLPLPRNVTCLVTAAGDRLPVQQDRGRGCAWLPALPALGGVVLAAASASGAPRRQPDPFRIARSADWFDIETPFARCRLHRGSGVIGSLFDKRLERELVGYGVPKHLSHAPVTRLDLGLNVFQVIDESPNRMPAWLIHNPWREESLLRGARVRLADRGPVFLRCRVTHAFRHSRIDEEILFYADSPRIDFHLRIRWRERGGPGAGVPQLKLAFCAATGAEQVLSDGPFVVNRRPADGQEQVTQKWLDLSGPEFGFTLYNDGRHGFDALGGRARMTLVRGSYAPDPDSDRGEHSVRLGFEPHGPAVSPAECCRRAQAFNRPARATRVAAPPAATALAPPFALECTDGVVAGGLRRAEHGDARLLRLFEAEGKPGTARLRWPGPAPAAIEPVDFLERPAGEALPVRDGFATFALGPCQILTLRIPAT
jgi:alpha-mannosidase